jgi:hypothetical protein
MAGSGSGEGEATVPISLDAGAAALAAPDADGDIALTQSQTAASASAPAPASAAASASVPQQSSVKKENGGTLEDGEEDAKQDDVSDSEGGSYDNEKPKLKPSRKLPPATFDLHDLLREYFAPRVSDDLR